MNKNILYLVIVALLIFNCLLIFKVSSSNSVVPREPEHSDSAALSLNKYYHMNNVVHSQLNNNLQLRGALELTGIDNQVVTLKSMVAHGPKLIVRSNEKSCNACIENEIQKVQKFAKVIGDTNIIVITTFSNIRKSIVFRETNHISLRIFTCPDLGMPFEKVNDKPFLFLLNPDLRVQNFFIPEISEGEVSQGYYSSIYKRYFRTSKDQPADIPNL